MIGIAAPSSVVPKIELKLGVGLLKKAGFEVKVHPQTFKSHLYFAGTDSVRAEAFFELACDPDVDVLWCARGGYGAGRLLPLLGELTRSHGVPPRGKLLAGYSDATALFEFVKMRWGWSVLHAPMPGLRSYLELTKDEWRALTAWVKHEIPEKPWGRAKLKYTGGAPASSKITAELAGGNLIVWTSLLGSPYFAGAKGKILFFEEISEIPYRIDRLVNQLDLAGAFEGVLAVVLGDFPDCQDKVSLGFDDRHKLTRPIRRKLDEKKHISAIFSEIGSRRGFPVFKGLPVGHGPGHYALPMGARYCLEPSGEFRLESWEWVR